MSMLILLWSCTGTDLEDTGYAGDPSTECTRYCNAMLAICEDTYAGSGECHRACDDWDDDGREGISEGDSVQCRTTYAEAGECTAAQDDSSVCLDDGNGSDGGSVDTGI